MTELDAQARYQICPRKYCLYFLGTESCFKEDQPFDRNEKTFIDEPVHQSQCGLNSPFGRCIRLDPKGKYDFYNTCDPVLKREGFPLDYFLNPDERKRSL